MIQSVAAGGVDPVCGMDVSPEDAAGTVEHRGQVYYFCNPSCLEKFKADPERYPAAGAGWRSGPHG